MIKKTTNLFTILFFVAFSWQGIAQTLNQSANWPNTDWSVTTITSDATQDIEADPSVDANFAYDDDDTGSSSHDEIMAESSVIDLTAAYNAGETILTLSGEYVFNNIDNDEYLGADYWDADTSSWTTFIQFANSDTSGASYGDYCLDTYETYESELDISSFTATQLSGFKYRFYYNDDMTGGTGWNYGFCFSSPTLVSSVLITDTMGWYNMEWIHETADTGNGSNTSITVDLNSSITGYAQAWADGVTNAVGQGDGVECWLGAHDSNTDPSAWSEDSWIVAAYLEDIGNNDKYMATGVLDTPGTFYIVSRWRLNGGPYTYGGFNGPWDGTSNNGIEVVVTLPTGSLCDDPIVIGDLPYTTSDDTANYGDDYENGSSPCNDFYMSGDDVFYAFTPANDINVSVALSNLSATYSGIHVWDACLDASPNCVAFEGSSSSNNRLIESLDLVGGTTYYIGISTWATPQSVAYDLAIVENTCLAPNSLSVTNISTTEATLEWVAGDSETNWVVEYGESGFTQGVGITENVATSPTLDLSGLLAATTYDFYVLSDCGGGDVSLPVGPGTFTTLVTSIVPDYLNDFETYPGTDWSEAAGPYGSPSGTYASWSTDDFGNDTGHVNVKAARVNVYGTSLDEYLISPPFDLAAGDYYFNLDIALTDYSNSNAPESGAMGPDDYVALLVTQDGGGSWSELTRWDSSSTISTTGDAIPEITLSGYGAAVKFAFYAFSDTSNEDNDFFIDNFSITSSPLSIANQTINGFKMFPNPVLNTLYLNAQNQIDAVSVYNMLGQEVLRNSPSATQVQLDMAALPTGAYIVKVQAGEQLGSYNLIKQ